MFELQETSEDKRLFLLLGVSATVLFLIVGLLFFLEHTKQSTITTTKGTQSDTSRPQSQNAFQTVALQARAAYVFDGKTGEVLYAKNAEAQLPLASITKLMTAITALHTLEPQAPIEIDNGALKADGDNGLQVDDAWSVRDLLSFTLTTSSNDGALALAYGAKKESATPEESFVVAMNKQARIFGLAQTYFLNPTGLDTTEQISGGYGSAKDVVHLLAQALLVAGPVLEGTRAPQSQYQTSSDLVYTAENTNTITHRIPGLIASKTGYTDLAGGNLVIAFDAGIGHPIYIAILGSTVEGRFSDVETLVERSLMALGASNQ